MLLAQIKRMSLFEEILSKYLEDNLMPRNKKELADFSKGLFKEYQKQRGILSQKNRNLSSEEAREMAKKGVLKRWGNKKD